MNALLALFLIVFEQVPNLRNVYEDSTYFKRTMLTWTAKGHAVTGFGTRAMTFISDNDSIAIIRK